jgi:hypothetical protein
MSIPKTFGRLPSLAAARKNAQRIFKEYRAKGPIPRSDTDDVADLLNNHPDRVEKIGLGVSCFCIELNAFGGPCFVIVQIDGSKCPFSLTTALTGEHPPEDSQIITAPGHKIWRDGESRGLLDEARDNRPSGMLMQSFIATEPPADCRIEKTGRGPTGLIDGDFAQRWTSYYKAHQQ